MRMLTACSDRLLSHKGQRPPGQGSRLGAPLSYPRPPADRGPQLPCLVKGSMLYTTTAIQYRDSTLAAILPGGVGLGPCGRLQCATEPF